MKRKYLFLMETEEIGGAQRFQIDYFKFIDFNKYAVIFGITSDIFGNYFKQNELPIEIVLLPKLDKKDGFFMKFLKYYKFFKTCRPNCVVFNQFWLKTFTLPEIMAAFLASKGNAYMIIHDCPPAPSRYKSKLHFGILPGLGLLWRKDRFLQTLLGYFTKNTIAVSKATQDSLIKFYKFPAYKVKKVYHGVDIDTYVPSSKNRIRLREELNIPDSDTVVVSTSNLFPLKRLERLVESFAILAKERNDIQLIMVGTGSEYERLINMVKPFNPGVKKRIKFLGFRKDISSILQLSDIFVLPSDSEGLPLSCLEAMSSGLICVVTDSGGTGEIIRDGWNGFLVEKSSSGVLEGLRKVLSLTSKERKLISANAREFIEQKFNLNNNIQDGLKLLKIK